MNDINPITVAVLITCHNRKTLTQACLRSVLEAKDVFNNTSSNTIVLSFHITDDACTDGTAEAIKETLKNEQVKIETADGNAFWAGGMRIAWQAALRACKYDYFLLLNDDTQVTRTLFFELFDADCYALQHVGKKGIYAGSTMAFENPRHTTFGGKVLSGVLLKKYKRIHPSGSPQMCDIVNANILFVPSEIVQKIGIFPDEYKHSAADNDYAKRASAAGFPVMITAGYCGYCNADNYNKNDEIKRLSQMSYIQRRLYFKNPVHSIHDTIVFFSKWHKFFIPFVYIRYLIKLTYPRLYLLLNKIAQFK